jgi:hypothetical protein
MMQFNLNIMDSCSTLLLTPPAILNPTYSYDIRSGSAMNLLSLAWTLSNNYCPSTLNFYLFNNPSLTAPDPIFSIGATSVEVNTNDPLKIALYPLLLVGS